jgi:hypothetical protein
MDREKYILRVVTLLDAYKVKKMVQVWVVSREANNMIIVLLAAIQMNKSLYRCTDKTYIDINPKFICIKM